MTRTNADASAGLDALGRAKRIAHRLPGTEMFDNLDTMFRSVYEWRDSGGRHAKLYECGTMETAMEMADLVSRCMRWNAVQGHTQLWSEGRIFVEFEGPHHSDGIRYEIDKIHEGVCSMR